MAAAEAARQAKGMGMHVVMDAGTFRTGVAGLVALVDTLIASETLPRLAEVETLLAQVRNKSSHLKPGAKPLHRRRYGRRL